MGGDINHQNSPLTPEERAEQLIRYRQVYEDTFKDIISSLNGRHDPRRFGIETEYQCVDDDLNVIWNGAEKVMQLSPHVSGDCSNTMLELNSLPFDLHTQGSLPCLEDLSRKECDMRKASMKAHGTEPLPIGLIPTFSTSQSLLDYLPERKRGALITDYIMKFMKEDDLVFYERDTGKEINFGKMPGGGLMDSLHISISGRDDRESSLIYNIANALCGPMIAISANSALVERKITSYEDNHLFVYEQNREVVGGIPRVGNVPFHLDSLEDYFSSMLDFPLIFSFNEEDPVGSLHNHYSSTWPWVRAQVQGFYRIEFRPLPKQPTLVEDMAVSTLFAYSLLALEEEMSEILPTSHSIRDYCNRNLLQEDNLITNTHAGAIGGYDAVLDWKQKKVSPAEILDELYRKAKSYIHSHGIASESMDMLRMVKPRIDNLANPSRRMIREVEKLGFEEALHDYYEHTRTGEPYCL